ncbi:Alpha/Beta hydrolase protein [Dichomitus squalens]|uniref:Alpha/Beta hydrolase protein n=1 Tax=Dichomitus squalens TaxID=114155 RepID=A0A4Q9NCP2_9APHY|nr:Alpha/Beta hydrolase protein [Dichomitus squalens]TBU51754.1 Alpha/Beta hydrolase protein [Dichomitus squalens]
MSVPEVVVSQEHISSSLSLGNGVELGYLDSGAPEKQVYTTIFAIHGMGYHSPVFRRVIALSPAVGVRFVAVTRRDYNGSTPYTAHELNALQNGSNSDKQAFLRARGLEIATFIQRFIQENSLPAPSSDEKTGGIGVLGWSLGASFAVALVANLQTYPTLIQKTLGQYLRALILQAAVCRPWPSLPPQSWSPQIDTSIPAQCRQTGFVQWITSYFEHGDLSTRDPNVLEYVLPTVKRVPSVFTMGQDELDEMTNIDAANGGDTLIVVSFSPQLRACYKDALYNKDIRAALPRMKVLVFSGDATANFGIVALWSIEDDDAAAGGGWVETKIVPGINHFVHWDAPQLAVETYLSVFD